MFNNNNNLFQADNIFGMNASLTYGPHLEGGYDLSWTKSFYIESVSIITLCDGTLRLQHRILDINELRNELPHDKTNNVASAKSDQSLRCPHEESLGP